MVATLAAVGAARRHRQHRGQDRDHCYVTSEAATDLGEVTEARRAVQPPVTRLQRPCSLAQPRPASLASLAVSGVNGPGAGA